MVLTSLSKAYVSFSDIIWDESIWFPPGVNWTTLTSNETEKYPDFFDLSWPLLIAFLILSLRFCFEWIVARPLGRAFGINDTYSELPTFFKKLSNILRQIGSSNDESGFHGEANGFSNGSARFYAKPQQSNGIERKSTTNRPHLVDVKSTLDKFCESCWRCAYYLCIFAYGIWALWHKPWFWPIGDTSFCWHGYPFQTIDREIWWYYMIEAAFYWSLTISQFVDVQRKDFWVNFVHHIATILLLYFSWADNFVRVGSLVLVTHDAADFWMESAKMARYTGRSSLCNALFIIFTIVWFLTRVGIYPFVIIYSTLIEAPALIGFYAAYYVFNSLLLLLLLLHVFWSIMILRIAINALKSGETEDVRSDDECELDSSNGLKCHSPHYSVNNNNS